MSDYDEAIAVAQAYDEENESTDIGTALIATAALAVGALIGGAVMSWWNSDSVSKDEADQRVIDAVDQTITDVQSWNEKTV